MKRYATDLDLTSRFTEACGVAADQRKTALDDACNEINLDRYREASVRAHCLVAMHYLVLSGAVAGGESGVVTRAKMGEIEAQYGGAFAGVDPYFATTIYGRQFLQLRASLGSHPEVG